jgi:hypothetical protein
LLHPAGSQGRRMLRLSSSRGTKQSGVPAWIASPCGFGITENVAVIVIARDETIRRTRMDCFTLRVRNDGECCGYRHCEARSNPAYAHGLLHLSGSQGRAQQFELP